MKEYFREKGKTNQGRRREKFGLMQNNDKPPVAQQPLQVCLHVHQNSMMTSLCLFPFRSIYKRKRRGNEF